MRSRRLIGVAAVAVLVLGACGGDDDDDASDQAATPAESTGDSDAATASDTDTETQTTTAPAADADADTATESTQAPAAASGGSGGGQVVLGDETITFDSSRCFLQEQDAAAGGGKILFVAQGMGVNAEGEEVLVDVSRYDEDSQFVGDSVLVDIGDPFSGDTVTWSGDGPIGTITVDGSTVSGDSLTFQNFDDFSEIAGSLVINC